MKSRYHASASRPLMAGTVLLVAAGTILCTAFNPLGGAKRGELAKALNHVRQVKIACDGFATDFDGQYPNKDTGERVVEGGLGDEFSNNYFRQLFLTGETQTEEIFWLKGASVCNKQAPDEIVGKGGRPVAAEILKPGDCGWAYMTEQTNTSDVARPLLIDAYKAGTVEFDRTLRGGKVIVLRIDGSATAIELDDKGQLLSVGEDILGKDSRPWKGSGEEPAKLLKQPEPAAAAQPEAQPE